MDTNNAVELYNLAEDIGERNNLSNSNVAKRDELIGDLFAWMKSTNAIIPTDHNPQLDNESKSVKKKKKP